MEILQTKRVRSFCCHTRMRNPTRKDDEEPNKRYPSRILYLKFSRGVASVLLSLDLSRDTVQGCVTLMTTHGASGIGIFIGPGKYLWQQKEPTVTFALATGIDYRRWTRVQETRSSEARPTWRCFASVEWLCSTLRGRWRATG